MFTVGERASDGLPKLFFGFFERIDSVQVLHILIDLLQFIPRFFSKRLERLSDTLQISHQPSILCEEGVHNPLVFELWKGS